MGVKYFPELLPSTYLVNNSGHKWSQIVIAPITTTDATETAVYSIPLAIGQGTSIRVSGYAIQSDGSNFFEIDNRNSFRRAAGGSVRIGTVGGTTGESSGNTWTAPRPSFSWLDPTALTTLNQAGFNIIGKAATTIIWYLKIEVFTSI